MTLRAGWRHAIAAIGLTLCAPVAARPLTLEQAVALARSQAPWLRGSHYREQAMQAESVAAGALPDPVLSLGLANLPADRFSFGREPNFPLPWRLASSRWRAPPSSCRS